MKWPTIPGTLLFIALLLGGCSGPRMVRAPAQPTQNFPREWGAPEEEPTKAPAAEPPPPTFDNVGD